MEEGMEEGMGKGMGKGMVEFKNIYEAENAIQKLINDDNKCSAHFKYESWRSNGKNKLSVITYNPKTKTQFLLQSLEMKCESLELYKYMYDHIVNLKDSLERNDCPYIQYKIQWYNNKTCEREISHFYGQDLQEILNKFYFEKMHSTIIFYMELLPQS